MTLRIKRIYEDPVADDGFRILVDRIWPRGVSKDRAKLDLWLKDVAPTTGLRQWFHHEEPKWPEFETRYRAELADNPAVGELRDILSAHDPVTLLYSARDEEENQAVVLRDYLAAE
jgi:DNA-3-methyladenine glycosylase